METLLRNRETIRSLLADRTGPATQVEEALALANESLRPLEHRDVDARAAEARPGTLLYHPFISAAGERGEAGFRPMWAGQAARLGRPLPARDLTERLAADALARIGASA